MVKDITILTERFALKMLGRLKFIVALAAVLSTVWIAAVERHLTGKVENGLILPPTVQAQALQHQLAAEVDANAGATDGE